MTDDPLWREVFAFLTWFQANKGAKDKRPFLRGLRKMIATVEAVEADPAASATDRTTARVMLDKMSSVAQAHADEVIRVLSETAKNPETTAGVREEASRALR